MTSDVLCRARRVLIIRAHPSGLRRSGLTCATFASRALPNQHAPCARPASARRLVKDGCLHEPGRLPSTSAPSTRPFRIARSRIAPQTHDPLVPGLDGSPPPFSQLCRREPASDARSPLAPVKEEWLDLPPSGGMAKRRSSTSATKTLREHDRSIARTPILLVWETVLYSLALGGRDRCCNPSSSNAFSPRPRPRWNRTTRTPEQPSPDSLLRVVPFLGRRGSSRGFTGQGPGGFRPPGALRHDCSRGRLRPDPIRSNTSCRELVATPAGEAAAADTCAVKRACPSRTRRTSPLALGSPNDPLARATRQ